MKKIIEEHKPDYIILSSKQVEAYKKLFGVSKKGQVVARGYHTWVTDGKGGVTIKT